MQCQRYLLFEARTSEPVGQGCRACLHVTVCVARANVNACNGCVQAKNQMLAANERCKSLSSAKFCENTESK